ncbi:rab3 GTPase-activating protein catalytic subunit-like isoform X2 [Apostichopus japonicus]|uniref:rab3 GTPase-activating protein catalytic subunit-like isoform X2 n=1 Tax=Stichopus japonicus TaxID=307972 RepID=UPI003AB7CBE7
MADDVEESEVFEITDFTAASEWERFVARLEQVIHDWKLTSVPRARPLQKGDLTNAQWSERSQEVNFANVRFLISEHRLKHGVEEKLTLEQEENEEKDTLPQALEDMMSSENDFPPRAHCLCRWYGLRHFVVLIPAANSDAVLSESKCNLLLSSLTIAVNNTSCSVPIFAQIQQKWRRMYTGICEIPRLRTNFDMVHLKRIPHQYNHLEGLLNVFKSKIASQVSDRGTVTVAVRFTYVLNDWTQYSWPLQFPDMDDTYVSEDGFTTFQSLPFGATADPIGTLYLSATWPSLTEDMVVDNDVYSDLEALQAPLWSSRINTVQNMQGLLGDYLISLLKLCHNTDTLDQLLGKMAFEEEDEEQTEQITHALQKLTDPGRVQFPGISSVVHSARSKIRSRQRPVDPPFSSDLLNDVLQYLFPDATVLPDTSSSDLLRQQSLDSQPERYRHFKAAPRDCLTYKLTVAMCVLNSAHGGLKAVAYLWHEFVLEMRYRWENKYKLPGISGTAPNMACCLVHQKLQMLNCCIARKKAREERQSLKEADRNISTTSFASAEDADTISNVQPDRKGAAKEGEPRGSESEDEFYECEMENEEGPEDDAAIQESEEISKPEGRLKVCGELKLLNSDEDLYIPVTQDPAPMTEDMLEEHAEVLAKLGTTSEGAELRAKMQSACLLSDMGAFKAANPGCSLEDFVRWYSPRDWVEGEEEEKEEKENETTDGRKPSQGHLSPRMQLPGNMWMEVWSQSKPMPAHRQKRLFDDTKEAEKVLHFLAALKPSEVITNLLPVLIQAALERLEEAGGESIPSLQPHFGQLVNTASRITRTPVQDVKKYEEIVLQISMAELLIAKHQSLMAKFLPNGCNGETEQVKDMEEFVCDLQNQPEVPVKDGPRGHIGGTIHKLFVSAQRAANMVEEFEKLEEDTSETVSSIPDFPAAAGREFILRTTVSRPAPYSRPSPQRMFCVLMDNELRLAGAFSQDTSFQ